uniref:Uncharacterized protein n=1 Tax=Triticum urartu TaxID=4572 RepID=A0A8R7QPJ5_TRIUA
MRNLMHHSVHDAPSLLFRLGNSFGSITRSSTRRTEADTLVTWKTEQEDAAPSGPWDNAPWGPMGWHVVGAGKCGCKWLLRNKTSSK